MNTKERRLMNSDWHEYLSEADAGGSMLGPLDAARENFEAGWEAARSRSKSHNEPTEQEQS